MRLFGRRATRPVPPPTTTPVPPSEPPARAPWALRVISDWAWRLLVVMTFIGVVMWLLSHVNVVAIAVIIGLLVTALLYPFVAVLNRRGIPRLLSTTIVFVLGLAGLAGLGIFVGTQVSSNVSALTQQVRDIVDQTETWLAEGPLQLDAAQVDQLTSQLGEAINQNRQRIATGAVAGLGTTVELVGGIVLAAFSTFFLLLDGNGMWAWFVQRLPTGVRDRTHEAGQVAWRTIGHYVRGTIIIAFTDAVAVTITLLVVRVPLAVPVGVLVFLGAFVPVLGLAITGALAVGLTLVSKGLLAAVIVFGVIVLAVQAEGHVLQPIVMSRAVRVHPLAVVLSVTAGGLIAGIFGAVIAVPLVAVINNMLTAKIIDFHTPPLPRPRLRRRQPTDARHGRGRA